MVVKHLVLRSPATAKSADSPEAAPGGGATIPTDAILQLASDIATVTARLDETRSDLAELQRFVRSLQGQLRDMTKADEIAHAVARHLQAERRRRLTVGRKALAAIAGIVVLVPALHDAWSWFG